jgi:hypothetical protein
MRGLAPEPSPHRPAPSPTFLEELIARPCASYPHQKQTHTATIRLIAARLAAGLRSQTHDRLDCAPARRTRRRRLVLLPMSGRGSVAGWRRRSSECCRTRRSSRSALSIGKGLMTISMPDRFRLAPPRGRLRRIGLAIGLLEQSRFASCRRPGRTKSTRLTPRRIAVWRLEWPPRVPRARRDGRDGSCANGRPRDVGHRCERWPALERKRDASFEPPLASQVRLGIKQLESNSQVLLCRPDCVRGHFRSSWCRGLPSTY